MSTSKWLKALTQMIVSTNIKKWMDEFIWPTLGLKRGEYRIDWISIILRNVISNCDWIIFKFFIHSITALLNIMITCMMVSTCWIFPMDQAQHAWVPSIPNKPMDEEIEAQRQSNLVTRLQSQNMNPGILIPQPTCFNSEWPTCPAPDTVLGDQRWLRQQLVYRHCTLPNI